MILFFIYFLLFFQQQNQFRIFFPQVINLHPHAPSSRPPAVVPWELSVAALAWGMIPLPPPAASPCSHVTLCHTDTAGCGSSCSCKAPWCPAGLQPAPTDTKRSTGFTSCRTWGHECVKRKELLMLTLLPKINIYCTLILGINSRSWRKLTIKRLCSQAPKVYLCPMKCEHSKASEGKLIFLVLYY